MSFPVTKNANSRYDSIDWNNLRFGVYFSDHIFLSKYKDEKWDNGEIVPYGPLAFEPALCTLHYGQSCFEGLKAFPCLDSNGKPTGYANIFRPEKNAERLNRSGERLCIPSIDVNFQIEAMKEIVKIDQKFIPLKKGQSLYLRPFTFGTSNFLGVQASPEYDYIIITSPVSSYYANGLEPIKILVSDKYVRAVRGGIGFTKASANYAASLYAGMMAKKEGFSQVLWLDGVELKYVDEVGAMNIMFIIDNELVTPTLEQGSILPGVTRMSVLELAKEMGIKVSERKISIDEIVEANQNGKLQECFGTGTAAVISPVGQLTYKGKDMIINNGKIGEISKKLYDKIIEIQYSPEQDARNWNVHFKL
jgi:branched-chain amino acid aminotransferase